MRTILLATLTTACVIDPGPPVTFSFERLESFDAVHVQSDVDAVIHRDATTSVVLTCGENVIDDVIVASSGGTLTIRRESSVGNLGPCEAVVRTPSLTEVQVNGSADVLVVDGWDTVTSAVVSGSGSLDVGDLTAPDLALRVSGSGDLAASGIAVDDLDAHVSGSGNLVVSGSAARAQLDVSGSGDIEGGDLVVGEADVSITGSGSIRVSVTDAVTGTISGSGDLEVLGDPPERNVSTSGSGDVRFL